MPSVELHATNLRNPRAYRIDPLADPGYTPHIGALVDMLIYARLTTLKAVEGLTMEQLDMTPPGFSNSIGMLLAHIAAIHHQYHAMSFEGRDPMSEAQFAPYLGALTMGEQGEKIVGRSLDAYLADLHTTLIVTLAGLASRNDEWLNSSLKVPKFNFPNHHWAWFHVIEEEISHRGQIRMLKKIVSPPN